MRHSIARFPSRRTTLARRFGGSDCGDEDGSRPQSPICRCARREFLKGSVSLIGVARERVRLCSPRSRRRGSWAVELKTFTTEQAETLRAMGAHSLSAQETAHAVYALLANDLDANGGVPDTANAVAGRVASRNRGRRRTPSRMRRRKKLAIVKGMEGTTPFFTRFGGHASSSLPTTTAFAALGIPSPPGRRAAISRAASMISRASVSAGRGQSPPYLGLDSWAEAHARHQTGETRLTIDSTTTRRSSSSARTGAGGGTLSNDLCQKGVTFVVLEAARRNRGASFVNDEWNMLRAYRVARTTARRRAHGASRRTSRTFRP